MSRETRAPVARHVADAAPLGDRPARQPVGQRKFGMSRSARAAPGEIHHTLSAAVDFVDADPAIRAGGAYDLGDNSFLLSHDFRPANDSKGSSASA